MPLFDNLNNFHQLEEPEEREALELKRSKKKLKRSYGLGATSVSADFVKKATNFAGYAVVLIFLLVLLFGIHWAISLFAGPNWLYHIVGIQRHAPAVIQSTYILFSNLFLS